MPVLRRDFTGVPDVAPMDWWVFSIWGAWDTILSASIVFISWLCFNQFRRLTKSILLSGITCWTMFFLLFWIGMVNMNLANPKILICVLPLCLFETIIAAWIAVKLIQQKYA